MKNRNKNLSRILLLYFVSILALSITVKAQLFAPEEDSGSVIMDLYDVEARKIQLKVGDILHFSASHEGGDARYNFGIMDVDTYEDFMDMVEDYKNDDTPSKIITGDDMIEEEENIDDDYDISYTSDTEQIVYFGITHYDFANENETVAVDWEYNIERNISQEFLAWLSENDLNKILLILSIVSTFLSIYLTIKKIKKE